MRLDHLLSREQASLGTDELDTRSIQSSEAKGSRAKAKQNGESEMLGARRCAKKRKAKENPVLRRSNDCLLLDTVSFSGIGKTGNRKVERDYGN